MKNTTKEKFLNGKQTFGTFIHSGSTLCAEAVGLAGLDYVVLDTEHSPFGEDVAVDFVRTAKLRGFSPLVRVKDSNRSSILRMLDIGMEGIIVPNVNSVDEVKELIGYSKYYPVGSRGFAFGRGAGYGHEPFAADKLEYCKICNREQLLIPQCETIGSLESIEEIVALEGVDGILIGPSDLSISLGNPFVFDDKHQAAVARVLKACKEAKKICFTFATTTETSKVAFEQGFDSVIQGTELGMLIDSFKNTIKTLGL
jgi:4-hydroxy-2-oxoheptanedioate aldolase